MNDDLAGLFRWLTAGVYVIGVAHGETRNAFTASWVVQASFQPPLLALGINPAHASYALLREGRVFSVNVLHDTQLPLAGHFGVHSGRDVDKLAGIPWRPGRSGAPVLQNAAAYFDCRVTDEVEAGDHRLVIGRVIDGAVLHAGARPLTYRDTNGLDGSAELYPPSF